MSPINVTKASGNQEPFDESKLRRSLKKAGASKDIIDHISESINNLLVEGISTRKIYKEAFRLLRSESRKVAGRYKLKEAIFELGPEGFHFEKFVAEILNMLGYTTSIGEVVKGECVNHEIDVIASTESEYLLVECKFHNRKENICNIKVPLYIQSRYLDVRDTWSKQQGHKHKNHKGMLATNTRFSEDAITYAECMGLKLLSWDYPEDAGIRELITKLNLHPITSLSSLSAAEKKLLLKEEVLFCKQICLNKNVLERDGIDSGKINRIFREAREICNNSQNPK